MQVSARLFRIGRKLPLFSERCIIAFCCPLTPLPPIPLQLPVPIAVLVLMYLEKLLPCCPGSKTRLLDKDELSMETQGTDAAPPAPEPEPESETQPQPQQDGEAGGAR